MAGEIPAGWYPNPWNDAEELYWSGAEWTGISRAVHRATPAGQAADTSSTVEESTIMRPVAAQHPSDPAGSAGIVPPPFAADAGAPAGADPQHGVAQQYTAPQYAAPQYGAPPVASPPPAAQYVHPAPYVQQAPAAAPSSTAASGAPAAPAFASIPPHVEQSYPTVPYGEMQRRDAAAGYPATASSPAPQAAPPYGQPAYGRPEYGQQEYAQYAPQAYDQQAYAAPPSDAVGPAPVDASAADALAETQFRQLPGAGRQGAVPHGASSAYSTDPTPSDAVHPDSADAATIRWALGDSTPARPTANPRARFGVIAMIAGIVAAIFAFFPFLSFAAWVPAFVAIAFGIISYLGGKPRGFALTGIIAGGAALAVGTGVSIWYLVLWGTLAH